MIGYIHASAQDTYKMLRLKGLSHKDSIKELADKLRIPPEYIKELVK